MDRRVAILVLFLSLMSAWAAGHPGETEQLPATTQTPPDRPEETPPPEPQETPPSPPPEAEEEAPETDFLAAQTPVAETDAPATTERPDAFPNLNIYLPEGELDIRLRKLIRNVLFEGQVNYEFADGDVSTFLRYKYYARNFTYRIGVFDTIEFTGIDEPQLDFDRVRGGLLLIEYPVDYNKRYFTTMQVDSLSFGDTTRPDNNQSNVYAKFGYQFGTPFDERLNSIVAESRGRIAPVLTAYREIGPQKTGIAVALTYSLDGLGSDFSYLKFESEALRRFDFGNVSFLISRAHFGSIFSKKKLALPPGTIRCQDLPPDAEDIPCRELFEQFTVPRYEFFKLGGRDAMKGIDDNASRGSDELFLANEFFYPLFRNRSYRFLGATFSNLFGIVYQGVGTSGFDQNDLFQFDDWAIDAGLGFETSFFIRDYEIFLNAVYAQTLVAPDVWEGNELRVSVRTSR
jgi:hypothetical protein